MKLSSAIVRLAMSEKTRPWQEEEMQLPTFPRRITANKTPSRESRVESVLVAPSKELGLTEFSGLTVGKSKSHTFIISLCG